VKHWRVDFFRVPTIAADARLRPNLRAQPSGEVEVSTVAVQRLGKVPQLQKDAVAVSQREQKKLKRTTWRRLHNGRRVVMEGGSIDVNGRGFPPTTEESLTASASRQSRIHRED